MLPNSFFFRKWASPEERQQAIAGFQAARTPAQSPGINLAGMSLEQIRAESARLSGEIATLKAEQAKLRPTLRMQTGRTSLIHTLMGVGDVETKKPLLTMGG